MLESQSVDTATAIRLRSTARSRVMPGRGVAVSAGGAAVVINGSTAEILWSAMEPLLMAGCEPEKLIHRFPDQGQPLIRSILDQLDEHDLLRDVEEGVPAVGDAPTAEDYLEQLTRRPRAAAALLARTAINITGTDAALNEAVSRALTEVGFAGVTTAQTDGTGDGVNTVRVYRSLISAEDAPAATTKVLTVLAVAGGGWYSAGPSNAQPFPEDVITVSRWARHQNTLSGHPVPAPEPAAVNLVAAQLALAALNAVARDADNAYVVAQPPLTPAQVLAARPRFMLTSPDLVSEPHPVTTLSVLEPLAGESWRPTSTGEEGPPDGTVIDALEPLWAGLFSRLVGPTPASHEQLPLGLAEAGTATPGVPGGAFAGTGLTTAQARLDALTAAATALAHEDVAPPAPSVLVVSFSREAAAADATVQLLDRHARWIPSDTAEEEFSPRARRMWAALVLRYHRSLRLSTTVLAGEQPLHRCQVWVDGQPTAMGIAARPNDAAEEALMRAAGITQLSEAATDDPELNPPRSMAPILPSTRDEVLAWAARNAHLLSYRSPAGAEYWSRVGLHPMVASWQ